MATFKLERIPKQIVDNVVQVSEVYQVQLVKSQVSNRKDVRVTDINGVTAEITRTDLVKNLLTLEGKPIRLIKLKYNKKYTMMRIIKTDCMAVRVPRECRSEFIRPNGAKVPHGVVLVMQAKDVKQDGDYLDMSNAKEIKDFLFRKLFSVAKLSSGISERLRLAVKSSYTVDSNALKDNKVDMSDKIEQVKAIEQAPVTPKTHVDAVKKPEQDKVDRRPRVVASVVDNNGNCIGYRIVSYDGSSSGAYTMAEVANLAREGKLMNVKFVQSAGKSYLAGIGCSLKELPVEPM